MTINQTISSCKAIFDFALGSQLMQFMLFIVFISLPLLKITASVLKTFKKTKLLQKSSSNKLPSKLLKIIKTHNLDINNFLISNDKNLIAVSVGIISKKIYLSKKLVNKLNPKELEAVILHEIHHFDCYHSLILFLTEIITAIFFFLPIFKDFQIHVKYLLEKSADNSAVSYQQTNKHVKTSLKKMLISDVSFGLSPQFSYKIIDQRIDNLNLKKTSSLFSSSRMVSSALVVVTFISLFFLNNHYSMAAAMEEKITCSLVNCVQGCFAYEINKSTDMSEINYSVAN